MRSLLDVILPKRIVRFVGVAGACSALVSAGCAMNPGTANTGIRLAVTLQFKNPIDPNWQYFFLIRNAGDPGGANGPIPIIAPPYLNGFATGLTNGTTPPNTKPVTSTSGAGFTDFVEFSNHQRASSSTGYVLYHLPGGLAGDPNANQFLPVGAPEASTTPAAGSTTLSFELNVNDLTPAANEPPFATQTTPKNQYLQVNVVATTSTPTDPQNWDNAKVVDAFGDQSSPQSGSFNNYITIDTSQVGRTYSSTDGSSPQEREGDTFNHVGNIEPAVDLTFWSIQIRGNP